jgi:glycerol-3-phosphate acyltransferase PlsY
MRRRLRDPGADGPWAAGGPAPADSPRAPGSGPGSATAGGVTREGYRGGPPAPVVLLLAFAAGAVPWSNIGARLLRGIDLRSVGTGTVSGTNLYRVAGFGPLAFFGCLDVAKGALGPLLAGKARPNLGALAASATLVGHDWSPLLDGAGGRGIAPALGAFLVLAPEGAVVLSAGMAGGRLAGETAVGCLAALATVFPVLSRRYGHRGARYAASIAAPIMAKRIAGNGPPVGGWGAGVLARRLTLDRDR